MSGYYTFVIGFVGIVAMSLTLTFAVNYYRAEEAANQVATPVIE